MAKSKLRKKEKTKKRIYLRCRLCGRRNGLSSKGYCPRCQEQQRLFEDYRKMLEERGLI